MQISLKPELENFINEKINNGVGRDASEVISKVLDYVIEQEKVHNKKLEVLRKEVTKGFEQLDRGEYSTYTLDDILAEVEAEFEVEEKDEKEE